MIMKLPDGSCTVYCEEQTRFQYITLKTKPVMTDLHVLLMELKSAFCFFKQLLITCLYFSCCVGEECSLSSFYLAVCLRKQNYGIE